MVYRIYVEKKESLALEAKALLSDINSLLQIPEVTDIRILNRYDAENIEKELFDYSCKTVFSEPQLDIISDRLPEGNYKIFAVEYLPGQFDQRADSAAQCIQIISQKERPVIKTARVYLVYGNVSEENVNRIKKHVINPVEAREASLEEKETLKQTYDCPTTVQTLETFNELDNEGLLSFIKSYGLAMDIDDIHFCQDYFRKENKNPTITEIRMIDTYWSDHCRHTTFLTTIDSVRFEDEVLQAAYDEYIAIRNKLNRTKPVNLMDIATIACRYLKKEGCLQKLDESEEINACTVKIDVNADGTNEEWLLLFKNETHNHPTEIEPFGGAATCIGGAIRDPLSGRSYVYAAMRVTGAADPLKPINETLPGKLPQRKLVTTAAAGYSSYGNQIGLATGQVDEIYHDGYQAKRMEIGAVIAAAPKENVRRECPEPGDIVILLGGRTGRDGCGGATGSSKSHDTHSLSDCGAEVQKGNAPEERKLQRLFRNPEASRLIKRCNDFGAGGVSVAIGELADGLRINLDKVPKKYDGLDGTELAISESQERMAVVVSPEDKDRFMELADSENLEATAVAVVTEEPRLVMTWNGNTIVDISREFLNTNGAEKHIDIAPAAPKAFDRKIPDSFTDGCKALADDLNICSKQGLSERFDSTIGAGTVLMPFGGVNQLTPVQAMVHKISVEKKHTDTCSLMAWGYNPFIAEKSPYDGAYLAVVESVSKLIAGGAEFSDVYLTFQEYFEKPMKDGKRWGKPLSALLGALKAQLELKIAAIGGKDSMSGTFEQLDVPPTLVSFAVTTADAGDIVSPEFKKPNHKVILIKPKYNKALPDTDSLLSVYEAVNKLAVSKNAAAIYTPTYGGVAEAIMKMCFGNNIGFDYLPDTSLDTIFGYCYGSFIIELNSNIISNIDSSNFDVITLGMTTEATAISHKGHVISLYELLRIYQDKLEPVYPSKNSTPVVTYDNFTYNSTKSISAKAKVARPRVLIPVFPGTNCEYDSAKAMLDAGAEADFVVINNLTGTGITESINRFTKKLKDSQIIFVPGGFSGGDEPDGSAKFITAFFRNEAVKTAVTGFLEERDGLMLGICNGFQALIKLGLLPFGKILDTDSSCPTLTFNTIGRHQSRLVRTRIASKLSPWLAQTEPGEIYTVPISHGEGRFYASEEMIKKLAANGQIATQYVDADGLATSDISFNPNNSAYAIEGITSPDGRIFGKMGHSERIGSNLYKNVTGNYDMNMFKSAVKYFS